MLIHEIAIKTVNLTTCDSKKNNKSNHAFLIKIKIEREEENSTTYI